MRTRLKSPSPIPKLKTNATSGHVADRVYRNVASQAGQSSPFTESPVKHFFRITATAFLIASPFVENGPMVSEHFTPSSEVPYSKYSMKIFVATATGSGLTLEICVVEDFKSM